MIIVIFAKIFSFTLENKILIIKNGCKVSKKNWIMQEVRRKLRVRLSDTPDIENYVYRMLPQLGSPTIQKFIKRLRRYIIPQNKKKRKVSYL